MKWNWSWLKRKPTCSSINTISFLIFSGIVSIILPGIILVVDAVTEKPDFVLGYGNVTINALPRKVRNLPSFVSIGSTLVAIFMCGAIGVMIHMFANRIFVDKEKKIDNYTRITIGISILIYLIVVVSQFYGLSVDWLYQTGCLRELVMGYICILSNFGTTVLQVTSSILHLLASILLVSNFIWGVLIVGWSICTY